jgi:hypothetical protein
MIGMISPAATLMDEPPPPQAMVWAAVVAFQTMY